MVNKMGKNDLPKWVDDWKPEVLGLKKVFGRPVDITSTPPEELDDSYYAVFVKDGDDIKCVKIHRLTLRDIVDFKKRNPDKTFVLSYDEDASKVRVS